MVGKLLYRPGTVAQRIRGAQHVTVEFVPVHPGRFQQQRKIRALRVGKGRDEMDQFHIGIATSFC